MRKYFCVVKYADGLTRRVLITENTLEENLNAWESEFNNRDGDEVIYLKIRREPINKSIEKTVTPDKKEDQ